jgi:hypothetical protein
MTATIITSSILYDDDDNSNCRLKEIQQWIELIENQPEILMESSYSFVEKLKQATKFLYDYSRKRDRLMWKRSIIKELVIDEMSIDQIWEELCLDNRPFLQRSSSRLGAIRKALEQHYQHQQQKPSSAKKRTIPMDPEKEKNIIMDGIEEFLPMTILDHDDDGNPHHSTTSPYGKSIDDTSFYYTADEHDLTMITDKDPYDETHDSNDNDNHSNEEEDDELVTLDSNELGMFIHSLSSEKELQEEKLSLSEESDKESLKSDDSKSPHTQTSISRSPRRRIEVTGKTAMYSDFFDPPTPCRKENRQKE